MTQRAWTVGAGARQLALFLGLAFGLSWLCWVSLIAFPDGVSGIPARVLLFTGTAGPLLAALVCVYRYGTAVERGEFWRRIYQVERLHPRWLLLILLLYPGITAVALGINGLVTGDPPSLTVLQAHLQSVPLLLSMLGAALLSGAVQEEPGWRGYALDRLLQRCSPLRAAIALGLVWACWHLPLYFVPGSGHPRAHVMAPGMLLFLADAVIASVVITRIYLANRHSVFAAILFHAVLNVTRDSVPLPLFAELVRTVLFASVAVPVWRRLR